jgi:hypothetical protein
MVVAKVGFIDDEIGEEVCVLLGSMVVKNVGVVDDDIVGEEVRAPLGPTVAE